MLAEIRHIQIFQRLYMYWLTPKKVQISQSQKVFRINNIFDIKCIYFQDISKFLPCCNTKLLHE